MTSVPYIHWQYDKQTQLKSEHGLLNPAVHDGYNLFGCQLNETQVFPGGWSFCFALACMYFVGNEIIYLLIHAKHPVNLESH